MGVAQESSDTLPVFTIGHSTRSIEQFVDILRAGGVQWVVDVRTVPRSRTNPQYNLDSLPDSLAAFQIGHCRIAELGGLRGRASEVPPHVNGYWSNQSFHNYADHALSPEFGRGLEKLIGIASERRTAIMCAESVWWRCHRRIIADYLIMHGREVFHLMSECRADPARLTPAARLHGSRIEYPTGG